MWKTILPLVLLGCSSWCSAFLIKDTELLFYFSAVNVTIRSPSPNEEPPRMTFDNSSSVVSYTVTNVKTEVGTNKLIQMKFNRDVTNPLVKTLDINLTLSESGSYWGVSNITATVVGTVNSDDYHVVDKQFITSTPLEAPQNKSFHCKQFGRIYPGYQANQAGNFTPVIEFLELQVQAFNGTGEAFGEPWDCVGFFTAGIWSGIFVAIILIAIMSWGLAMIMDVKTMDRFDDPKGKPISFGGAD